MATWREAAEKCVLEWQERSAAYEHGYGPQNFQTFITTLLDERRAMHRRYSDTVEAVWRESHNRPEPD
jgi:hypothetical protein